jgi:hypothetical protein
MIRPAKKQLGQFFTTNSDYILQGLEKYVHGKNVSDPFAGGGDLLQWAQKHFAKSVIGYDVDSHFCDGKRVFHADSILEEKEYEFVLTNPPYLNINKASPAIKSKYFRQTLFEDLYQLSLYSILNSQEGIVIVPINFLSAENSSKIRNLFFARFRIVEMNYFRQPVFADTTYNVIAFYYKRKEKQYADSFTIKTHIYPEKETVQIELFAKDNWTIGGSFIREIREMKNLLGIFRLTEEHIRKGPIPVPAAYNHLKNRITLQVDEETYRMLRSNLMLLKAIDSGSENGKVAIENIKKYNIECLVSKPTSRHQVYLVFQKPIPEREQVKLIDLFNQTIEELRKKHLSLFLTNYRDKDRKRISFEFAYKLLNYIYFTRIRKRQNEEQPCLF